MQARFFLVLLVIPAFASAQVNLSLGDDLRQYLNAYPPKYKTSGPAVLPIAEGTIDFYKYKDTTTDIDLKILKINDKWPVGVLQNVDGKSQILMDLDGDGKLDTVCPGLLVPFWVITQNTPDSQKGGPDNVRGYFQTFYESFQSSSNPYGPEGQLNRLLSQVLTDLKDNQLPNRKLLFALFSYYQIAQLSPEAAFVALGYVITNYTARYDRDHPLFYLYTVESMINLGQIEQARSVLKGLLARDPNYVPALVYQWQLEADPMKKKEYYKQIKQDHPDHWMVKQI